MVGVAGKSKGCSTCRRRKKGCDLARPVCGPCIKSGNVCGGYQRELTFIHHKAPSVKQQRDPPTPGASKPVASRDVFHPDPNWSFAPLPTPPDSSYSSSPSLHSVEDGQPDSTSLVRRNAGHQFALPKSPSSLRLTAMTSLHTSLFQPSYLASMANLKNTLAGHPAKWMSLVPSFVDNDPSLQFAYLALTSARIGHDSKDDNLVASSRSLYGRALRELQGALSHPRRRFTKETLTACSTLALYEIYTAQGFQREPESLTQNAWLSHAAAVSRLLEARGPEAHTAGVEHEMFLHMRHIIAIRSCSARKPTFLSQPAWLHIPWQKQAKTMFHKLVDVMVFIPLLAETYDDLEAEKGVDHATRRSKRKSLLCNCLALADHLRSWYVQLCAETQGQPLWHTTVPDDPNYPFPRLFTFDSVQLGYQLITFWTCSLIVQGMMWQLQLLLCETADEDGDGSGSSVEPLPEYVNPRRHALNIAQSLPYFTHPDKGALGPNLALFPLGMAFGYLATASQPAFVPNRSQMGKISTIVDDVVCGQGPHPARGPSTSELIPWFIGLFAELGARNLPGGAFLSSLLRQVSQMTKNSQLHSVAATIE